MPINLIVKETDTANRKNELLILCLARKYINYASPCYRNWFLYGRVTHLEIRRKPDFGRPAVFFCWIEYTNGYS